MDLYLPALLPTTENILPNSVSTPPFSDEKYMMGLEKKTPDDFFAVITSIKSTAIVSCEKDIILFNGNKLSDSLHNYENNASNYSAGCHSISLGMNSISTSSASTSFSTSYSHYNVPSLISTSWKPLEDSTILSIGSGLVPISKHRLFPDIKLNNFCAVLNRSASRPSRTEDDYDYPDDLPTVKINRFRSYRAKEASEILGLSGDDLLSSSIFCQLWMELRNVSNEKLRMSYSHPMDDGQSRTFKVIY